MRQNCNINGSNYDKKARKIIFHAFYYMTPIYKIGKEYLFHRSLC